MTFLIQRFQLFPQCKYFDDPVVECFKMLTVLIEAKEGWIPSQDLIDNISHNIVFVPEVEFILYFGFNMFSLV